MIKLAFNPFKKDLESIEPIDLLALKETCEGWYIEYKSQTQETKKIAKSLSSFSNHYGGWLFYGISEESDSSRTAGSFKGIPNSQIFLLEARTLLANSSGCDGKFLKNFT